MIELVNCPNPIPPAASYPRTIAGDCEMPVRLEETLDRKGISLSIVGIAAFILLLELALHALPRWSGTQVANGLLLTGSVLGFGYFGGLLIAWPFRLALGRFARNLHTNFRQYRH